MAEKARFWREELDRLVEEFGEGAIPPALWAFAQRLGIDLTEVKESKAERLLRLADAMEEGGR